MTPSQIGRYVVDGHLGSGAFANVFSAFDPLFEIEVALKVLAESAAFDPDTRERFINEARLQRQSNHDNVLRVHDLGEHDGRPFLVMDLATGGTLADRLDARRGAPADVDVTLRVAGQLASGMHGVHQLGVVHRDLKPSNLLIRKADGSEPAGEESVLSSSERIVIADFGLARALHATGLTAVSGTPGYMAPEQWDASGHLDERTDLYAATMIVAEMLTGRPPIDGPAAERWRDLPPAVEHFLLRGTSAEAEDRQPSVSAWIADLGEALDRPIPELPSSARRAPTLREPALLPANRDAAPTVLDTTSDLAEADRTSGGRLVLAAAILSLLVLAVFVLRAGSSDETPVVSEGPARSPATTVTDEPGRGVATTSVVEEASSSPAASVRSMNVELFNPTAATSFEQGSVLVADGDRLLEITEAGSDVLLSRGVIDEPALVDPELRRIADVVVAPDGSVIIADVGSDRVLRVTPERRLEVIGSFAGPAAVAVTDSGVIFVAESIGRQVLRIENGKIDTFGPEFVGPIGLAIDGGSLVVAERSANQISRFNLAGELLEVLVDSREGAVLAGIATSTDGSLFWVDAGDHTVYRSAGDVLERVVGTGREGAGEVGLLAEVLDLSGPLDVAVAGEVVLVVDTGNDRVLAVEPDGSTRLIAGGAS